MQADSSFYNEGKGGGGPALLFLKRNIWTNIDLVLPNIAKQVHRKQNSKFMKARVQEFQINQKVTVRNCTPESK